MFKIQKNKYILGWLLSVFALLGSGTALAQGLEELMEDYVDLSFGHFAQKIDGGAGSDAALASNSAAMATNISETYDEELGSGFAMIWNERLALFDSYLSVFENGSVGEIAAAKEDIDASVTRISAYLEEIVTDFPDSLARTQFSSVNELFYAGIEAHAAGDTAEFEILKEESVRQITVLSQSLSDKVAADLIVITLREEAVAAAEEAARIAAEEVAAAAEAAEIQRLAEEAEAARIAQEEAAAARLAEILAAQEEASSEDTTTDTDTSTEAAATSEVSDSQTASTTSEAEEEREKRTLVKSEKNTRIFIRNASGSLTPYPFSDVGDTDDYAAILDIKNRGIVEGYDDGTYLPDNPINRAEFTKIVVGSTVSGVSGFNCFGDVRQEWFAGYVCTAKDQDIVGGYPDGTFRPGNEVNLAEAYKIVGETLFPGEALTTDVWYQGYVDLANSKGYALDSSVTITASVTRGQMATIISKALAAQEAGA